MKLKIILFSILPLLFFISVNSSEVDCNQFKKFSAKYVECNANKLKNYVSYVFFFGIVLFSGSIYAIHILNYPVKSIWFVTPMGGLLFMIGWILMIYFFLFKVINKKK